MKKDLFCRGFELVDICCRLGFTGSRFLETECSMQDVYWEVPFRSTAMEEKGKKQIENREK